MDVDYSTEHDSDEDYEGILKQAFEVKLTPDFNPNSIPQDGHEYLQHVMYQRKQCKRVTYMEREKCVETLPVKLDQPSRKISALAPSIEWQLNKLAEFKDFKNYLESVMGDSRRVTSFNKEKFMQNLKQPPVFSKFSILAPCAKMGIIHLLTQHISSLEPGVNIDDSVGLWIFAALASLDVPLLATDCHSVRELAKMCLKVRSNLSEAIDKNSVSNLNFFICIIARFYGQLDLADQ